jgi:hypothetical protein
LPALRSVVTLFDELTAGSSCLALGFSHKVLMHFARQGFDAFRQILWSFP